MKKKLYALFFMILSAMLVAAEGMKSIWISTPNLITPYLNKSLREKLVTFNQTGVNPEVNNLMGGVSKLDTLTGDFLQVELSDACTLQMKVLPLSGSDSIVCVVKTFHGPAKRSDIKFFSTDWKELDDIQAPHPSLPQRPDTMDAINYDRLMHAMDGRMEYASLHAGDNGLTMGFSVIFVTDDELKSLRNLIRETLWKWDGNGFVPSLASVAGLE